MKKFLSFLMVLSMILSGINVAFAADLPPKTNLQAIESINISNVTKELIEIPIYFTYVNNNLDDIDFIKESVSSELDDITKNVVDKSSEQLHIIQTGYKIIQIEKSLKIDVITNPLYVDTFTRIQEMINQGVKVNYVNLFVKEQDATTLSNDPNDPAYWEEICTYLGTYNNYKFLYLESAANVESSWVTPGNIGASLKWNEIAKKTLEAVLDHYIKGNFYKAVKAVSSGLSSFFDYVDTPLSVTYSSAGGYLKAKVSGTVYLRTVLIRDRLDRIPGHAYYTWGHTERFQSNLKIDAKWPISLRPGGTTYNYSTGTHTFPAQYSNTNGFYGNSTLYSSIINLYENTIGYFTHDETIDINSIVTKLLN